MNKFLVFAFLFFIGCEFGWVLELFYRRLVSGNKHFINPGFLTGPYLPIYGFGLYTLYIISESVKLFYKQSSLSKNIIVIVMLTVAMTVIEYIAGMFFTRVIHIKLWDYSDRKFNISGVICPLYSLFWGILGAIYYFFVNPHIQLLLEWFSDNIAFSFVIGMFFGVFLIDVFYSFQIVHKVKEFAEENRLMIRYEELKEHIRNETAAYKIKYRFLFALRTPTDLSKHLKTYLEIKRKKITGFRKH